MQGPPSDADVGRIALDKLGRRDVGDLLAGRDEDVHMIEAKPGLDIVVEDAELLHRADDVALLDDPDSVDGPGRVTFDDVDAIAFASERDRRRKSTYPAADNQNFQRLHCQFPFRSSAESVFGER